MAPNLKKITQPLVAAIGEDRERALNTHVDPFIQRISRDVIKIVLWFKTYSFALPFVIAAFIGAFWHFIGTPMAEIKTAQKEQAGKIQGVSDDFKIERAQNVIRFREAQMTGERLEKLDDWLRGRPAKEIPKLTAAP